ncbi:hypothetical protein SC936_11195 [Aggregatibacter actinomycetemcomitans serotype e str. SC936]|nr:hypothetical protein SC936_11195 [Aggregatibacter actinomycetemcomitans serotype e str. SC936]TYB21513.1 hypothetical protein FXB85_04500 [Aggregatibacter actinomycetemcomitans]
MFIPNKNVFIKRGEIYHFMSNPICEIKFLEIRENNLENLHHFYLIPRKESIVLNQNGVFYAFISKGQYN